MMPTTASLKVWTLVIGHYSPLKKSRCLQRQIKELCMCNTNRKTCHTQLSFRYFLLQGTPDLMHQQCLPCHWYKLQFS